MKPAGTISVIAASFFLANAPSAFAQPQKKSTGSGQENVTPLVNAAMKNMESGVWSVNGTVQAGKTIKVKGLLDGEDFDLTTDPGIRPNTPMREIIIKDKVWICSDGETWHAGQPNDRLIYNWTHVPIMAGGGITQMPFEKVGTEQRDGQTWLHVRMKVPEKNVKPKELPQYWLVLDSQGQAEYIGHTDMPMFSQARKEVMYCSFDYAPANEKIAPPPLGPPIDDKAYGFNDIEQHKFDWKNKIIRLEVTPAILESKQIAEDTYRGFFKDTATPNHYGVVEFPHDALVKLGFLKKIVSGAHASEDLEKMGALGRTEGEPVSFYIQVIPIGEKPAARTVAVGARVVRDPDGSVSYTWETGEKQAAKSSPASAAPDASDGDLVNRGIEKAKNGELDGAIADFDRAIELNPKDDAPYYNRAQARRLKNDTAGAIADYTKAIELSSTNPAAYNNRGNARAENKDRDGAIADYTRAIELKPDYARAYYNRAMLKKEKGDAGGAAADFKRAQKLDPELVSEESAPDSSSDRATADGGAKGTTVSLLDGKLKFDLPSDFSRDPDDPKDPKTVAKFSGPDGAWGGVLRGTHGLTPDQLEGYLKMRVAEYSKNFKWLPKDSQLQWLKKDIVTIDGRKWADWSFVPMLKGKKDYSHNPVYT
ncbi:MAG TPA: tetratricopeptide repeat protein, partial [Candidatus Udaeobacter sp.]|nr:tetratricopeptide repeat protein [Candidatus Udaeobacter sp.]